MEPDRTDQPEPDDAPDDPFRAALAAAERDDEPYTDEQRAAADEGWQDFIAGHTIPWDELRRSLLDESFVSELDSD